MKVINRTVLATVAILLMAGCAQLSPQQVAFNPELSDESIPNGAGTTLMVEVEDRRPNNEIGRRGGAYPESSTITPQGNLGDRLRELTEEVIQRAGYQQVDMNPEVELNVSLDELKYTVEDIDATRKGATASAQFSVQAVRGGSVYSNSFRAQRSIETLRYPSTEENSDLLNHVFDAALERMFADPGLEAFLNQ